jgi:multiple sugar transport system substrate-binding protein
VPKKSKVVDAAWSFVRYIMMPQNLMPHNIASANIPPRKSVAHDPSFVRQLPYMAPLIEILPYAKFIGPFNTDVLKEAVQDVFLSLCHKDGKYASVSAALAALEKRVNTDLKL